MRLMWEHEIYVEVTMVQSEPVDLAEPMRVVETLIHGELQM